MLSLVQRLIADEAGQDLAEYGIALAIIALGAGSAAVVISTDVNSLWSNAQSALDTAV